MIEEVDPDNPSGFRKPLGQFDVFLAGRRIPARVVVNADDGCALLQNGFPEYFPRVSDARVKVADEHDFQPDYPAFGVQEINRKMGK